MDEETQHKVIFKYLRDGSYPDNSSKNEKRFVLNIIIFCNELRTVVQCKLKLYTVQPWIQVYIGIITSVKNISKNMK